MKKIDGYIAVTFIGPFLLCLGGLVGLFVVIDFFANVDEFARASLVQTLRWAAVYYVLRIPWYLVQIMPVLSVLPAVICLLRLQRTNELCSIRAAGTSARRSAAPILVCSALVMVLAGLNQELLVPALREPLGLAERKAREADEPKVGLSHAVDKSGRFILVGSYDEEQPLPTLSDVEITEGDPAAGPARVIRADRAFAPRRGDWDRWFLEGVEVETGSSRRQPEPPRQFHSQAVATLIRAYRADQTGVLITADPGTGGRRAFRFGEYTEESARESFWPVARRVEVIDPTSREEGWLRINKMVWVDDRWLMFGGSRVRETDLAARRIPLEELEDGAEFRSSLRPADIRSGEFQRA
ncbi:MAG: LptF/LptG family permease, partial [bacterium]